MAGDSLLTSTNSNNTAQAPATTTGFLLQIYFDYLLLQSGALSNPAVAASAGVGL